MLPGTYVVKVTATAGTAAAEDEISLFIDANFGGRYGGGGEGGSLAMGRVRSPRAMRITMFSRARERSFGSLRPQTRPHSSIYFAQQMSKLRVEKHLDLASVRRS